MLGGCVGVGNRDRGVDEGDVVGTGVRYVGRVD